MQTRVRRLLHSPVHQFLHTRDAGGQACRRPVRAIDGRQPVQAVWQSRQTKVLRRLEAVGANVRAKPRRSHGVP